jgi:septum site-determining protein MinC
LSQNKLPLAKKRVLLYYFNNIIVVLSRIGPILPDVGASGMGTKATHSEIGIKGIRDGLLVTLGNHQSMPDLLADLAQLLQARHSFLKGSRIALAVGNYSFTVEQLEAVQTLFTDHELMLWTVLADLESTRRTARQLGLATRLPGSQTDLDGNLLAEAATTAVSSAPTPAAGDLFLRETVRSGRSIFHEGSVTILGDVNPGAEIIAAGSVVVWGRLRGLVHAGAMGDKTAVICALDLNPTQLRIADQIAISPNESRSKPLPEQATIRQGQIVAEPWHK